MLTIARIGYDSIIFQNVTQAELIPRHHVSEYRANNNEYLKGFSDWNNSGNMMKASFDHDTVANIQFSLINPSLGLNFDSLSELNDFQVNEYLKKDIASLNRCSKKLVKLLDSVGACTQESVTEQYLIALFKVMNVQFATISHLKFEFDKKGYCKSDLRDAVLLTIEMCNS